jgi:ABC-2 type transport system permease protein
MAPGGAEVHVGGELSMASTPTPPLAVPRLRRFEPFRPFRIAWLYFRVGVMNELQYRINFFVQLGQSVLQLGTGLAVLALVFGQTTQLNGWTRPQLLAVLGVQILMGGVIHTFIQPNMTHLLQDVREGKLDFALTKPEDAQVIVSVRDVRIWQAVDVLSGVVVLVVAIVQLGHGVGAVAALSFVAAIVLGGVMIYCFWLVVTTGSFWLVRMDEVVELFEGVFQTGRWPVGTYPRWLRTGLTYLVPIAFAVTVPAEALTGRLNGETLGLAAALAVVFLAFTRWFWRRGLKRYSGASS